MSKSTTIKPIALSVPVLKGNEWRYVKECLDTGWISSVGKYVQRFEEKICAFTGAKHAVACVNGTSALHIALLLADVKAKDEVIVPTLTFIASVNVIKYVQASPVFMDCGDDYNIDPRKTMEFIKTKTIFRRGFSYNKKTKRRISALMVVHVFGHAVDMDALGQLCRERNIRIVEDAAESLGTCYRKDGRHTGTIGDIGCFSFNGNKIISTGGGGMLVSDDAKMAHRARYLTTQAKDDPLHYVHHEVGFNYRLSNVQAAIGVAQLELLAGYIKIKEKNFKRYQREIDNIPGLKLAQPPAYARSNYWFYSLQIDQKIYGLDKETLLRRFHAERIEVRPVWELNHMQKPYRSCETYQIKKASELFESTLNIPCSVSLTGKEIVRIVGLLKAWKK